MLSLAALVVVVIYTVLMLFPLNIISFSNFFKPIDGDIRRRCPSRMCGRLNISHPFMLQDSPADCGDPKYTLSCDEDEQLVLYWKSGKFRVKSINYNNYTIRLLDANLDDYLYNTLHHNYSSLPPYSSTSYRSTPTDSFFRNEEHSGPIMVELVKQVVLYLRCPYPVELSSHLYVDDDVEATNSTHCINGSYALGSAYGYYVDAFEKSLSDLGIGDSCRIEWMYPTSWLPPAAYKNNHTNISCTDISNMLFYGFELSWAVCFNKYFWFNATIDDHNNITCGYGNSVFGPVLYVIHIMFVVLLVILYLVGRTVLGAPFLIIFCIYKWRRRHLSLYGNIEEFLQSDNRIMPIGYSYKDIKRITGGFKTKLGNGGFGSVFRGQLRSGRLVAVKVLNKAKSNGQDFINEVATIGRIHHVNVVQLIGFCVQGSKRALIYELMEKGSLEKYIFSNKESDASLSCEKLYNISLGVARGIEYLHNGCDMKILHFDIKPHNILLDQNFNPKVSDFGLARLYPTDNSIVSLTAARGTIGYMAPELFYRNVGAISYKVDVYSFGVLLMEIAGRRKNLNAQNEHSSQIYFPFWVYDQLHDGKEIEIENDTYEETKLAKRMMIVALWCIQTKPSDRPSMAKVVEMLEQDEDLLEMPPKPYFYDPNDVPPIAKDHVADQSSSSLSFDISVSESN